jgi:amino acid transporter
MFPPFAARPFGRLTSTHFTYGGDTLAEDQGHHLFHDTADAQHAKDTAQLATFGYTQELKRSLGFFSTFAIAFSFISATNGFYALFYYGLDVGGPAGLIWQWPLIVFGQFMVALVFAEAASHYPLAGGVYQWAKRFMGGTYGWWVAWMFAAALLVTVAAVAFGVAPIVCSLMGWKTTNSTLLWIAVCFTLGPMLLNIYSVKVTAFFNNIGTVTEIVGLVVIAIALYIAVIFEHAPHQGLGVLFNTTPGAGHGALFGYGSLFLASMLTGAWVLYGFDTAGGLAEETVNPTREVPRAMLIAVGITAVISAFWLVAMVLAIPDVAQTQAQSTGAIAYIFNAHFSSWVTNAFLISVCAAIFVCCLAIQAAATRLLFAYGRDKMIPASKVFGYVHPRTKTPMMSALFIGVGTIAILLYINLGGGDPFIKVARVTAWATAGTYIAYQMVIFGGLFKRSKGWPTEKAYFNLGKWGWPVNIIAFVYGVLMIINLSWPRTPAAKWYDNYIVVFSLAIVVVAGIIVYFIQRARGVDLSATIHEIELPPAAPAMAAAMPGTMGDSVSSMRADEGPGGPTTLT